LRSRAHAPSMGHDDHPTPERPQPISYRLQVRGPVPARLADELDGFTVHAGAITTITGPIVDPAALYGLIARLECLGLDLLSILPAPDA
jgi:hypothetical protein